MGQSGRGGRPDCVHLHQAKMSSHAGYLLNQHRSMLGVSPDRVVVTCEPGSRQQVQTIVQLIPECHHHSLLRSPCVGTPSHSLRRVARTCAELPTGVPVLLTLAVVQSGTVAFAVVAVIFSVSRRFRCGRKSAARARLSGATPPGRSPQLAPSNCNGSMRTAHRRRVLLLIGCSRVIGCVACRVGTAVIETGVRDVRLTGPVDDQDSLTFAS